jgi:2-amino-4-hydroxy-6-hydroxymethyldihydropteridine diphosphokinase
VIAGRSFTGDWPRIFDLEHFYLIALGSNQRHTTLGPPQRIIEQAFIALEMGDIDVFATSRIIRSAAVGPSLRQYANAAAIIASDLSPPALLTRLKSVEAHFGRRIKGQKWRARVLDIDIILWSGGIWSGERPALAIPHRQMHHRHFVLGPAHEIAANWRDPVSGFTIKHHFHRLMHPIPLDAAKPHH